MRDRVRLSARNPNATRALVKVHFRSVPQPLKGGMARRKKAADEAAIECRVRLVTKEDGRQVLEIEIPDEATALAIAAKLVRGARE